MDRVAAGQDPKAVFRDPAANVRVPLPNADLASVRDGHTAAQILGNPRLRMMCTSYVFQAGQPDAVRQAFADAMGMEPQEFRGLGG